MSDCQNIADGTTRASESGPRDTATDDHQKDAAASAAKAAADWAGSGDAHEAKREQVSRSG